MLKKSIVAMAMLVFAFSPPLAPTQVSRGCRWNVSSVPVYIDLTSFDLRGWDREHIIQEVVNAMTVWNTEAGGVTSMYFAGDRAVSPVYNENLGKVSIFAAESGGCPIAIAAWGGGGDCSFGSIAVYDRINEDCPPAHGIEWMLDAPEARMFSMTAALVHEFGHVIGGYGHGLNNTVMSGAVPGAAPTLHLYNTDIQLFQNGDPAAEISGYRRRHHAVRFMHSTDAVNWTDDGTVIGWSYLRPAAAASLNSKIVAYAETLNTANIVETRRFTTSGGWEQPVRHEKSYTGPALANIQGGIYVLAYTEESDTRRIWVKTSDDGRTWSAPILLHDAARTQSDPALFYNVVVNRVMAFWTDRDTDRLMYSSSGNGISWVIPRELDQNSVVDPREYYSFRGPTGACDNQNQCLLVFPSWNTYGLGNLQMCTLQMSFDANTLMWDLLNLRCPDDGTGRTPGIAFGGAPGFSGWVLGFAGRDTNNTLATLRKSQHTTAEAWSNKSVLIWKNADGVGMIYNPNANRFEVYLVSR